jgi:hypothetical protein
MAGNVMAAGKTLTIFLAADLKKFNSGLNDADRGLKGFAGNLSNMVGPALIAAAAAAGALAIKFGVDGVKAAIEDEAALNKLATTLDNVGLAHDQPMVEDFIGTLERATGIADDELRPAYDRLVRSIGDTAKTNDILQLSMDISAGTGKSLQAVTEALGKAYDGNTAGLSRLGAGIDSAVLKTGDMDLITGSLASTFAGQAATSAGTYEGQIKRLSQAADNLKESFGRGLLTSIGDTNNSTQNLVDTMEDLEPIIEGVGTALGTFATTTLGSYQSAIKRTTTSTDDAETSMKGLEVASGATGSVIGEIFASLTGPNSPLGVFGRLLGNTEVALEDTADAANNSVQYWNKLTYAVGMSTQAYAQYIQANLLGRQIIQNANKDYKDLAARQKEVNTWTYEYTGLIEEVTTGTTGASTAVKELTKYEERLQDRFEKRTAAMKTTASDLADEIQLLKDARTAVDSYAAGIENSLSSAISLGAAYQGQFDSDGKKTGQSWISAFDDQINLVTAFGNNLNLLKQSNVPDTLIQELASLGAPVGNAIVEDMLAGGEGLINTLSTKWVDVQATMKTLAGQLVPEGLIAGEATAAATVDGLATQLLKETDRLNKIGKNMAKPVGAKFKAQLLSDIADSIREVEAAGTAARIEKVAQAERQQVALTNQAVAQALQNLLRGADARNGAPIAPVLS